MEKKDKLNRGEFVKFMENLIENSDVYKRNDESLSYVIALDSPWGTGKSFFIDLLIIDIENNEKLRVVKYNAWENDYNDNAFNPLIYDILNSNCLQFSTTNDADKEIARNILKNVFNIGVVFSKQLLKETVKNKTGFDIESALDEALKTGKDLKLFMLEQIPNLAELEEQRKSFEGFKKYLSNATEKLAKKGEKLVIIIDELDRCKPTFAVQTLEIVKHIFDVKNTVFIFSVDLQQLSYSLSSIYGQGFDAVGYLRRFFDYIAKLPVSDIKEYIAEKIEEIDSIPNVQIENWEEIYGTYLMEDSVANFFIKVYKGLDFSLRDFDTVLQSYKIMLDNFLKNYKMVGAHMIYIFYMSLKYKCPRLFNKVFIDTAEVSCKEVIKTELASLIEKICPENKWIMASIQVMKEDLILEKMEVQAECDERGDSESHLKYRIVTVEDKEVTLSYQNGGFGRYKQNKRRNPIKSFGNIIFDKDLEKWEEIKNMTYRQYLHKQLEMYNFAVIEEKEMMG